MGGLLINDPYRRKPSGPAGLPSFDFGGGGGGGATPISTNPLDLEQRRAEANAAFTGGGGGGGGTPPASQATLHADTPPEMKAFMDQYTAKLKRVSERPEEDPNLQTQVDRLGQRLSADTTQRAVDVTTGRIKDQAAGRKSALRTALNKRGLAGSGGVETRLEGKIDDQAARTAAGAATDIQLGREHALDSLVLGGQNIMEAPGRYTMARDQGELDAELRGYGAAEAPSRLALAQGGLNLDTYRTSLTAQQAEQDRRDRQISQLMALMHL